MTDKEKELKFLYYAQETGREYELNHYIWQDILYSVCKLKETYGMTNKELAEEFPYLLWGLVDEEHLPIHSSWPKE